MALVACKNTVVGGRRFTGPYDRQYAEDNTQFCKLSLSMISKVYYKILVLFGLVQNLEMWVLAMAKFKKVILAITSEY